MLDKISAAPTEELGEGRMSFFYLFVIQPNGVRLEFLEVNFILTSDYKVMFRRPVRYCLL